MLKRLIPIVALLGARLARRSGEVESPRNETEALLSMILSKALDGRAVGIHENFFSLGVNSLMLTVIAAKFNEFSG